MKPLNGFRFGRRVPLINSLLIPTIFDKKSLSSCKAVKQKHCFKFIHRVKTYYILFHSIVVKFDDKRQANNLNYFKLFQREFPVVKIFTIILF